MKAGVVPMKRNDGLLQQLSTNYPNATLISHTDTSWEEKETLAHFKFIPKPVNDFGLETDVVVMPRYRKVVDNKRNWRYHNWQALVDNLVAAGYRVGLCGTKKTSYQLTNITHYAWDHVDIDSDVEMILKTKLVIGQDSGLIYLAGLCRRPVIMIGQCFTPITSLHLDQDVFFYNVLGEMPAVTEAALQFFKDH